METTFSIGSKQIYRTTLNNQLKNKNMTQEKTTQCPDSFLHLSTGKTYACVGNDGGYYWTTEVDEMEAQKFDQGDCEPIIIVSAFQFKNGIKIKVITSFTNLSSFRCYDNWDTHSKPFAECPVSWITLPPREWHLRLRNAIHDNDDFVVEQSTKL